MLEFHFYFVMFMVLFQLLYVDQRDVESLLVVLESKLISMKILLIGMYISIFYKILRESTWNKISRKLGGKIN